MIISVQLQYVHGKGNSVGQNVTKSASGLFHFGLFLALRSGHHAFRRGMSPCRFWPVERRLERQHVLALGRCGRGNGGGEGMSQHRQESREARLTQRAHSLDGSVGLCVPDLRSVCPRTLLERLRRFPLLAVSLEEDPTGAPPPFAPSRGSWCIPAAAPVNRRSRRAATMSVRRSHHPATAHAAPSHSAPTKHSSITALGQHRKTTPKRTPSSRKADQ
jgi:hypothetical protein